MAKVGRIEQYEEGKEEISNYLERLEQYFAANDVANDKKVPVLLSVIGPITYAVLKNIVSPDPPSGKTFAQLKDALKGHYNPKPLVISERYKFHCRAQKENESVADYVVELKRLAMTCDFGAFLAEALRDRFVCGLHADSIRKKLLAEVDLTFQRASEIALAEESASAGSETVHGKTTSVYKVSLSKPQHRHQGFDSKSKSSGAANRTWGPCYRCGERHNAQTCKFKDTKCHSCEKMGHIAKTCRSKPKDKKQANRTLSTKSTSYVAEDDSLGMYTVYSSSAASGTMDSYKVTVDIDKCPLEMEVDTGAAASIIPERIYKNHFSHIPLVSTIPLKTYAGGTIPLKGEIRVPVTYGDQNVTLPLVVAQVTGPPLFGRNWLKRIKLNWRTIFAVTKGPSEGVDELLHKYRSLFQPGMSTIKGHKAHIRVKEDTQPIFCRARPVPYALKDKVGAELGRLEREGVITKVESSDWAAPIVIVPKSNGSLRICGDYKVTINRAVEIPPYPLPNTEDLFATLAGGTKFSKLDLAHAFQQVELDETSKEYLTINTHLGLFRYNKLPFGVSSAPAIFQSIMDQILQGLEGVVCRGDDILIKAGSDKEHLGVLHKTCQRLEDHAVHLGKEKCHFLEDSVEFMGHIIDRDGLHQMPSKVEAVMNTPRPTSVTELKAYLGLLNYYGRFLPDMATTLHPLHFLLRKGVDWKWTEDCTQAFQCSKDTLMNSKLVVHYDPKRPL